MAIKAANEELRSRINRAASMIGRGVNQKNPAIELEGRRQSALAHIENQILLGRAYFTKEDLISLSNLLFDVDEEDYTADAVETTAEALAASRTRVPVPDAEGEYEDDEDL